MWIRITEGMANVLDGAKDEPYAETETLDAFADEVLDELAREYPRARIDYVWEPSDAPLRVEVARAPVDFDTDALTELVREIGGRVYERGEFWRLPAAEGE